MEIYMPIFQVTDTSANIPARFRTVEIVRPEDGQYQDILSDYQRGRCSRKIITIIDKALYSANEDDLSFFMSKGFSENRCLEIMQSMYPLV